MIFQVLVRFYKKKKSLLYEYAVEETGDSGHSTEVDYCMQSGVATK